MTASARTVYKDDLPENTLSKIQTILKDLGIEVAEKWFAPVNGLFSLQIYLKGTGIRTNGKGLSREYARASAYGEFMERLQNFALINLSSPEIRDYQGFYQAPDEKLLTIEDITVSDQPGPFPVFLPAKPGERDQPAAAFLQHWLGITPSRDEKRSALRQYSFLASEGDPSGFTAVPFYNVSERNIHYMPSQLLRLAYGSNGMCAGNSPEEAIAQGICEVLERYANLEILKKKIIPPTIPAEYISEHFPKIDTIMAAIEQQGNFKLIFKDCSLGKNLPVTALIVIDSAQQKYFVKFGAYPALETAMERCLTELFQCRDIKLNQEMPDFKYYIDTSHPANIMKVLKNGYGYYPAGIFSSRYSYEFSEFPDLRTASNRDKLRFLTGLIKEKGYQLLVRDVSFLGFPSYHVLIPGLSEVRDVYDLKLIQHINQGKEILPITRNLNQAGQLELEKLITYLRESASYLPTDNLANLLGLTASSHFLSKISKYLLISLACCKLKKYREAREAMDIFLRNHHDHTRESWLVCKCARDYLEALAAGADRREIQEVLSFFYPQDTVDRINGLLLNPEQIFAGSGVLNCWNCDKCDFRASCVYDGKLKALQMRLKEKYAENTIDQNRLRYVFAD